MTKAPEDALVERVAEVLEEEFFDECAFDARNCAKAVLEALDITTLLERERRLREAGAGLAEEVKINKAGLTQALTKRELSFLMEALSKWNRAALNPEGVLPD